jgi:hypothetical protein
MNAANEFAILTLAAAASFATALLLNWATLTALFHILPRPARVPGVRPAAPLRFPMRLRALPTPPGEALPEPRRAVPALPGVLRRAGPGPRPLAGVTGAVVRGGATQGVVSLAK